MAVARARKEPKRKRIMGEHFRADGSPKRRFATEREADDCIRTFSLHCFPYHCTVCDGYHLATRRGRPH